MEQAIYGCGNVRSRIYARSVSINALKELGEKNKVHSRFRNGVNLQGKENLIFIDDERQGQLPFGIHLKGSDLKSLLSLDTVNELYFRKFEKEIIFGNHILDMSRAKLFSPKLPTNSPTSQIALDMVYHKLEEMDFENGLGMTIRQMLSGENPLINELRKAISSHDIKDIKNILSMVVGRGKGLTPSGDDILVGLIYLHHIKKFISRTFLQVLKQTISKNTLTTDISKTYYMAAFSGLFGSILLNLHKAMLRESMNEINFCIRRIIDYGHTSGRDTLSGIALGINIIYLKNGGI